MKDEIIVYKVHLFSMPEVPEKPIKIHWESFYNRKRKVAPNIPSKLIALK